MSKVNFGIARYGRGYTLVDSSCSRADGTCAWTAGNKPTRCSAQEGVISLTDIKVLSEGKNLKPTALDSGHGVSMMDQITWDDQWIGYGDDDANQNKTKFARSRCFGGTMTWSVD
jgi:chitinase